MKAPFTWPKSSLSRRSPGSAPQLTATNGPGAAGRVRVERPGDDLLAGAALAGDQDGRVAPRRATRRGGRSAASPGERATRPCEAIIALEEAVVVLGRTEDDEVPGARVAVVRDVRRDDGGRQRDEARAPLAAAEDGAPPLLAPPLRRAPRAACRPGRRASRRPAPRSAFRSPPATVPGPAISSSVWLARMTRKSSSRTIEDPPERLEDRLERPEADRAGRFGIRRIRCRFHLLSVPPRTGTDYPTGDRSPPARYHSRMRRPLRAPPKTRGGFP